MTRMLIALAAILGLTAGLLAAGGPLLGALGGLLIAKLLGLDAATSGERVGVKDGLKGMVLMQLLLQAHSSLD